MARGTGASGRHSDPRGDADERRGTEGYTGRHRKEGYPVGNQDPNKRGLGNDKGNDSTR